MEPIWQDTVDLNAFELEYQCDEAANVAFEAERHLHETTLRSAYSHQSLLDKQVSIHLPKDGLVDARTMLDTEDRQDVTLDMDQSFAYHDEDTVMIPTLTVCHVDNYHDALQFTDRLRGQHTAEERMSLQLLKLLRAIGAPNYAYGAVMDIFTDAIAAKVLSPGSLFRQRETTIKHFANRFCLQKLYPTTLMKHMNGRSYPVVLHDAEVMINSLLNSTLMVDENMLFPDMENPFGPPPATVEIIGDVDTGKVYRSAYHELCTHPNDVLCPLIMYLDRICIDQHGRCSLEPAYATLGI
jgi:hypothetical protein